MNPTIKKLRFIFLPFLVIAIAFIIGYSFLNWALIIKWELISIKEDVVNFWLPFGLPWIPVLIWLRPRTRLLSLTGGNGNKSFLYQFVAVLAIGVPTMVCQSYLSQASGTLTHLTTIAQIDQQPASKFYTINHFYVDKMNSAAHAIFDVSGKRNENFNMDIYVVSPIVESITDTAKPKCLAWLGIKYHKQISNSINDKDKDSLYKKFAEESQKDFDEKDLSGFTYLSKVGNTDDGDGFKTALKESTKYDGKHATIFLVKNEPFETRGGNTLAWIFGAFGIIGGIWLIMILIPAIDEAELQKWQSGSVEKEHEESDSFISLLKPSEGFFVTPIIIYINVLVFLIMVFAGLGFVSFKAQDLLTWGGNYKPSTIDGEWWRLVTNIFLHGGIMHLVANMYGLLFVGIFLEPFLGRVKYAAIYLITGIVASCASIWWHDAVVSVGASGAIFGLYGFFLAFLLTKVFPPEVNKAFLSSTVIFIGYNLLMGFNGGIDNAAHIGGLVSGCIIGLILYPKYKNTSQ